MAQQIINVGATPNDGTGDTLRDSQIKANDNFTELYINKLDDAPSDGKTYGRKDGAWNEINAKSKAEKYLKNIEIYDLLGGYNVIGGVGNPNSIQYQNRGSYNLNESAWVYETLASVGSVAYNMHNLYDHVPTQFNVSDRRIGFYAILGIKLTNYASTNQRFMFGLKWNVGALSNINPSDFNFINYSVGRDAGDANLSFFIYLNGVLTKVNTGISYNIQEVLIFEAERYTGTDTGYLKITTGTTGQTFTYNITDFRNNDAMNLGVSINNASSTDVVGYVQLINKFYYDL